jgi:hypothetical protein
VIQQELATVKQQAQPLDQPHHVSTVAAAPAIVMVDSSPAATATIGAESLATPATFKDVTAGKVTITLHADGYTDYRQDLQVSADKATDLGKISLARAHGNLTLSSPQKDVTYTLTGPDNYTHEGSIPDKLAGLPTGVYQLTAKMDDWQLPPMTVTVTADGDLNQEVKFPYGSARITSTPTGATVRRGNVILGRTPLALDSLKPGSLDLSVDLPPYVVEHFTLTVPASQQITKNMTLRQDRDFIAACGMPMVWIPDGYWVAKYLVSQAIYEAATGSNPSSFHHPNHPVENVTWEEAKAFCDKLNLNEARAGTLPKGFHYALPTEAQWEAFSADANLDLAVTSRMESRSSTQPVGSSEPNKYGLYDTLGNVWEWCQDTADDNGAHILRGGSWLSSTENFPNAQTHSAGAANYSDRFTGFRMVLVPQ